MKNIFNRIKNYLSDSLVFLRKFLQEPSQVGSILPSSDFLAEEITKYVRSEEGPAPQRYLEAGAGTGAFTEYILKKMSPLDHLDIVEIDEVFCELLQKKYRAYKNVHIYQGSILDWHPKVSYEGIISSLPFNAFDPAIVQEILLHYQLLTKEGGVISYFEYQGFPEMKKIIFGSKMRKNSLQNAEWIAKFSAPYLLRRETIWKNFPPAIVHHLRMQK